MGDWRRWRPSHPDVTIWGGSVRCRGQIRKAAEKDNLLPSRTPPARFPSSLPSLRWTALKGPFTVQHRTRTRIACVFLSASARARVCVYERSIPALALPPLRPVSAAVAVRAVIGGGRPADWLRLAEVHSLSPLPSPALVCCGVAPVATARTAACPLSRSVRPPFRFPAAATEITAASVAASSRTHPHLLLLRHC